MGRRVALPEPEPDREEIAARELRWLRMTHLCVEEERAALIREHAEALARGRSTLAARVAQLEDFIVALGVKPLRPPTLERRPNGPISERERGRAAVGPRASAQPPQRKDRSR